MAKFIINNFEVNIFHRILIRTNKTLDSDTSKLAKIYQTHLHNNKISTKTINTRTLQGRYQRAMDVERMDILKETVMTKKTKTVKSVKDIPTNTRNNNSITNKINQVIYSCYKINEQIKHKIEILEKLISNRHYCC